MFKSNSNTSGIVPLLMKSINYLSSDATSRRKLPINEIFSNIYKFLYPVIYNHNYKNLIF